MAPPHSSENNSPSGMTRRSASSRSAKVRSSFRGAAKLVSVKSLSAKTGFEVTYSKPASDLAMNEFINTAETAASDKDKTSSASGTRQSQLSFLELSPSDCLSPTSVHQQGQTQPFSFFFLEEDAFTEDDPLVGQNLNPNRSYHQEPQSSNSLPSEKTEHKRLHHILEETYHQEESKVSSLLPHQPHQVLEKDVLTEGTCEEDGIVAMKLANRSASLGAVSQGSGKKIKRPSNPVPRYKRPAHIDAEYRRRGKIQKGFDMVQTLVPALHNNINVKQSKASMLQKTADYIRELTDEHARHNMEMVALREEVHSLQNDLQLYQQQLPSSGVNSLERPNCHAERLVEEYLLTSIARDFVLTMLRSVSTTTSVISEPEKLQDEVYAMTNLDIKPTSLPDIVDWGQKSSQNELGQENGCAIP